MQRVAVIGAGRIGFEIAEAFAAAEHTVVVVEDDGELREGAAAGWRSGMSKRVTRGKLTEEQSNGIQSAVHVSGSLKDAADADVIIYDRSEDDTDVQATFTILNELCGPSTIFTVDSPNVAVTAAGAACGRPGLTAGLHFSSPAHIMKYVEVIPGLSTTMESVEKLTALAESAGKNPHVIRERPGGIMLNLMFPLISGAIRLLELGAGSKEAIDASLVEGAGYPMGPLQVADLIGLDVYLEALEALHARSNEDQFWPPDLLRRMVSAGLLGRKSKQGFYSYEK